MGMLSRVFLFVGIPMDIFSVLHGLHIRVRNRPLQSMYRDPSRLVEPLSWWLPRGGSDGGYVLSVTMGAVRTFCRAGKTARVMPMTTD
jgi:hypothetical protein